jgi:hypothetical protein
MMKPEANGNATRWQGYVARDGFGITLIRNHISAANPVIEGSQNSQRRFTCPAPLELPDGIRFFSKKNVITPAPYQIRWRQISAILFRTENAPVVLSYLKYIGILQDSNKE